MDSKEHQSLSVCHTGVVLRVLLAMLVVVWLFTGFGEGGFQSWVYRWVYACVGAVPACLLWLVVVCALRAPLARLPGWQRHLAGVLLGGLAGAYGHVQGSLVGWWLGGLGLVSVNWWPAVGTGAAGAWVVLYWLESRQQQQLPAQTQARLDELKARIRPHFLFNTLNTAVALVQDDPERAEEVLLDLAELFRRALSEPDAQTMLSEEIQLAERYLGIERLRFGDRLVLHWQLDARAADAMTPVLLLQPLVENAIRHGVEPSSQGGWVRVSTERSRDRVILTVTNSLPSVNETQSPGLASAGHGLALANVEQRLRLLHDVEAQFEAGHRPPSADTPEPHYRVRCSWPA